MQRRDQTFFDAKDGVIRLVHTSCHTATYTKQANGTLDEYYIHCTSSATLSSIMMRRLFSLRTHKPRQAQRAHKHATPDKLNVH